MAAKKSSTAKERKKQRRAERNLSFLAITLCVLSFISRITLILCNTYFILRTDYISLIMATISDTVIILCPFCSFFVFYNFNGIFRKSLLDMFKSINIMPNQVDPTSVKMNSQNS